MAAGNSRNVYQTTLLQSLIRYHVESYLSAVGTDNTTAKRVRVTDAIFSNLVYGPTRELKPK